MLLPYEPRIIDGVKSFIIISGSGILFIIQMSFLFLRALILKSFVNPRILIWARRKFSSGASTTVLGREEDTINFLSVNKQKRDSFVNYGNGLQLSPLFLGSSRSHMEGYKIKRVDNETWQVSSGLADVWKGNDEVALEAITLFSEEQEDNYIGQESYVPSNKQDPDFDEIEDMRVCGNLFYEHDKHSKEYEEYKFDFHRRKSSNSLNDQIENAKKKEKQSASASRNEKDTKSKEEHKEIKPEKSNHCSGLSMEKRYSFKVVNKNELLIPGLQVGRDFDGKMLRTPTFN